MFWPYAQESAPKSSKELISVPVLNDKVTNLNIHDDDEHEHELSCVKGPCGVCGIPSRSRCAGCSDVYYCSKKHQQTHWTKHKVDCRPISIPSQHWKTPAGGSSNKPLLDSPSTENSKYMIVNKDVAGGKALFTEKPLIVCPNFPIESQKEGDPLQYSLCFGCYRQFKVLGEENLLDTCKRCLIPLCRSCISSSSPSHHDKDVCQAIADGASKNRQLMLQRNERLGQSVELAKDYTILKLLLLQKSSKFKWDAVISLKGNLRYQANLRNPTECVKQWMATVGAEDGNYTLSDNYYKSAPGFKDRSIKLEEIIRIFAIFSDVAFSNPCMRVMYELRSWVPHSCSPNAEYHFKTNDNSHTLYLTAVEHLKSDSIVSVNYMSDYDEGKSKTMIRLFNKSRMTCALKSCQCKFSGVDSSVGLKCSLFPPLKSGDQCQGHLAPMLDPPNPEKPNLGLLIYVKSKSWNCSKCRKSEKFSSIQKIIKELNDKVKQEVEEYCKNPNPQKFTRTKALLQRTVSDSHWLYWKLNEATLKCWDGLVGSGNEMLKKMVSIPPGPHRLNVATIVNLKIDLYGNSFQARGTASNKHIDAGGQGQGLLSLLEYRHGRISLFRAEYVFDAFYANFIKFSEDFKQKLSQALTSSNSLSSSMDTLITDTLASWRLLINMLQEVTAGLQHSDDPSHMKKASMASEMHSVLQTSYLETFKNRNAVLEYMKEYLEMYCCLDTPFLMTILSKFCASGDGERDIISRMFDPKASNHCVNLTFGSLSAGQGDAGAADLNYTPKNQTTPSSSNTSTSTNNNSGSRTNFKPSFKDKKPEEYVPPRSKWSYSKLSSDSEEDDDDDGYLFDDGDPFDVDLDELFNVPMAYYESLLSQSVRQRMQTEKLLRDLMS